MILAQRLVDLLDREQLGVRSVIKKHVVWTTDNSSSICRSNGDWNQICKWFKTSVVSAASSKWLVEQPMKTQNRGKSEYLGTHTIYNTTNIFILY